MQRIRETAGVMILTLWMMLLMACPALAQNQPSCAISVQETTVVDHESKTIRTLMVVQVKTANFVAYRAEVDFGTTGHHNWKQLWKVRKAALSECEKQLEKKDREEAQPQPQAPPQTAEERKEADAHP